MGPLGDRLGVDMQIPTADRPAFPPRERRVPRCLAALAAALAGTVLSGCSVGVPDPSVRGDVESPSAVATPTITPGHDAEAVAGRDLPFASGPTLAKGVPVTVSDGLKEAPGWKLVKDNVAGESQYLKADGCLVSARVRSNQAALAQGGDKESTVALFTYLDPTILPEYLKTETLRWGGERDAPVRSVEVLALEPPVSPGGRAVAILARLFATAGSSAYVTVSCPDPASLAAARTDVQGFLPLLPPSN